jgi:UDP-N-acetylglucosamine diphosphorylase/glucosamine-1-phosphate N-acetyltransferase
MINRDNIHIKSSSRISAGVILDATSGPIIIDEGAFIDIGALIKGPAYIGIESIINPGAKLRGHVSIGPSCKIGGEIEHTTFHGYSNKQHDGYLGHSYVGEWVNLGANTNNSDLKNNYSDIRVDMGNRQVDTGETFVGCFIGDYTKTGISTMINTGTYIGLGCNVFGSSFQDKHIPNFSWGTDGKKTDLDKFIQTLKIVKERRDQEVTPGELELLNNIYKNKI